MPTPGLDDILGMSVESLRANKLRSALTVLGMVIGISSVISLSSIGQGVQKATEGTLESLGTNVMLVLAGPARISGVVSAGAVSTLTLEDSRAVEEQAPAVAGAAAILRSGAQLVYEDRNTYSTIMGTEEDFPQVRDWPVLEGQFFTARDVAQGARVVVMGITAKERLFGEGATAVGEQIRMQGERYRVVGVMSRKGGLGNTDPDDQVYLPVTTMANRIVGNNAVSGLALTGFFVKVRDESLTEAAQFQITNLLRLRHNIRPGEEDDFSITSQVDLLKALDLVVDLFTVMIVAIGAISLVVGGIGIANIMLVSVVERTREIGIRKALGATELAILLQFLTEAVVVSLSGGVVGIVIGIGIAGSASALLGIPLVVSVTYVGVSFSISIVIGLLAGVIPARNASKLDPIVALRTD